VVANHYENALTRNPGSRDEISGITDVSVPPPDLISGDRPIHDQAPTAVTQLTHQARPVVERIY